MTTASWSTKAKPSRGASVERYAALAFFSTLPEDGSVPDWIEILPLGEFDTNPDDSRGPFHADGSEVIAGTKANGLDRGLSIDYDHRHFRAAWDLQNTHRRMDPRPGGR